MHRMPEFDTVIASAVEAVQSSRAVLLAVRRSVDDDQRHAARSRELLERSRAAIRRAVALATE